MKRDKLNLTRESLVEILKKDGTMDEVQEALQDGELLSEEWENIQGLLTAQNDEQRREFFDKIIKDMNNGPEYDTGKEEKKHWRDLQKRIQNHINDLELAKKGYEEQAALLEESIETLKQDDRGNQTRDDILDETREWVEETYQIKLEDVKEVEKYVPEYWDFLDERKVEQVESMQREIEENAKKLAEKTAQIEALMLVEANAKSMKKQAAVREREEFYAPIVDSLKKNWNLVKQEAKELRETAEQMREHAKKVKQNTKKLAKESKELAKLHPIQKHRLNAAMRRVKHHLSEQQKYAKQMKKIEDKMIKKANKSQKQTYELSKMAGFSKGRTITAKEIDNKHDAIKVLEKEDGLFAQKRLAKFNKLMNRYQREYDENTTELNKYSKDVVQTIQDRRKEIAKVFKEFEQMRANDQLTKNHIDLSKIETNISDATEYYQFGAWLGSKAMQEHMASLGLDGIRKGQVFDMAPDWELAAASFKLDNIDGIEDLKIKESYLIFVDGERAFYTDNHDRYEEKLLELLQTNQDKDVTSEKQVDVMLDNQVIYSSNNIENCENFIDEIENALEKMEQEEELTPGGDNR